MATLTKAADDAMKTVILGKIKAHLEEVMTDSRGIEFVIDMLDGAYDLVADSLREGKAPDTAAMAAFLISRGLKTAKLANDQRVQCGVALVELALSASTKSGFAAIPVAGPVVYMAMISLDVLDAGGQCHLAYVEWRNQESLKVFVEKLKTSKAHSHAMSKVALRSGPSVVRDLDSILAMPGKQPNQSMAPRGPGLW